MASEFVEGLQKARAELVRERREAAERMANPTNTAASLLAPNFVRIQEGIEAIDRAIADEEGREPNVYEKRGPLMV